MAALKQQAFAVQHEARVGQSTLRIAAFEELFKHKPRTFNLPLSKVRPSVRLAHIRALHELEERVIPDYELMFIEGKGRLILEKEEISFEERSLLVVPPFERHRFDLSRGAKGDHIAVHFDLAPQFPFSSDEVNRRKPYRVKLESGVSLPKVCLGQDAELIQSGLTNLVSQYWRGVPLGRMRADAMLFSILAQVMDKNQPSAADSETTTGIAQRGRVNLVLGYIDQNLASPLTPDKLAEVAGMSRSHSDRMFRRWTGLSPREVIAQRRMTEAQRLLAEIDLSVKEIALRCGFEDQFHFSRVFRRLNGVSPVRYRELRQAGLYRP